MYGRGGDGFISGPIRARGRQVTRGRMKVRNWLRALRLVVAVLALPVTYAAAADVVDPSTLTGKMIMGYQGWFACPGDAAGRGWVHWKSDQKDITVDMLPDVSELSPSERCDSGLVAADGSPIYFFSDQNPKTVDRHFEWMETYGIDGVALQRFATELSDPRVANGVDNVLANVRAGAERHGRVFFVMYDLSGLPASKLSTVVEDWRRLNAEGLTKSSAYLRHKGRPLLGLWGVGFAGRDLSPAQFDDFLTQLRSAGQAGGGVTFVGGVPTYWREGKNDASPDLGWKAIWPKLDVISPWTVGRYAGDAGADNYRAHVLEPDMAATKAMGVDLMPVLFPGFSWANLTRVRHKPVPAKLNQIPRRCGAFYWRQTTNAVNIGATMLYTAMFDEMDEGTAMFKINPSTSQLPRFPPFLTISTGGCSGPSDTYLQLSGKAQAILKARTRIGLDAPSETEMH